MNPNSELTPELETLLQNMQPTEARDPQLASRARQIFLAEAGKIARPVSISPRSRLEEWKAAFQTFWIVNRKEKNPMFNFVMTIALVLGAVLGGGATTVAAAQNALPDEILYPVKTWSETVRISWETNPQAKFELALQLNARRAAEIVDLLAAGEVAPEAALTRFQAQQQQAVQLAYNLPDELVPPALERVREQARQQEQVMQQLQLNDPACEQLRERVREMLQTQLQIGLEAPVEPPAPGPSYGPGEPFNQGNEETPAPGSGFGPGDGTCEGCTPPGSGNGDPQNGDPQNGDTQNGDPQNGDTQNGDPQNGDPQNGGPQDGGDSDNGGGSDNGGSNGGGSGGNGGG